MWKAGISGKSRYEGRPGEQRLLKGVPAGLRTMLPPNWVVEIDQEPAARANGGGIIRPDALMKIRAPDGTEAPVVVEATSRLSPRDVPAATSKLRRYQEAAGTGPG